MPADDVANDRKLIKYMIGYAVKQHMGFPVLREPPGT